MWLRMPARHVVSFGWTGTVDVWLCKPLWRASLPQPFARARSPSFASPPRERAYLGNYRVPACCTLCSSSCQVCGEMSARMCCSQPTFRSCAAPRSPARPTRRRHSTRHLGLALHRGKMTQDKTHTARGRQISAAGEFFLIAEIQAVHAMQQGAHRPSEEDEFVVVPNTCSRCGRCTVSIDCPPAQIRFALSGWGALIAQTFVARYPTAPVCTTA